MNSYFKIYNYSNSVTFKIQIHNYLLSTIIKISLNFSKKDAPETLKFSACQTAINSD